MKRKIELYLLSLLFIANPTFAIQQVDYKNQTVASIIEKIISWVLGISGAIAVLFIVYGGLIYVTSAGNKDRQSQAKTTLTYAVIGLIVIILARFIVAFVNANLNNGTII